MGPFAVSGEKRSADIPISAPISNFNIIELLYLKNQKPGDAQPGLLVSKMTLQVFSGERHFYCDESSVSGAYEYTSALRLWRGAENKILAL
jgi:hypothetical protein